MAAIGQSDGGAVVDGGSADCQPPDGGQTIFLRKLDVRGSQQR
jgi:hypothetical protein